MRSIFNTFLAAGLLCAAVTACGGGQGPATVNAATTKAVSTTSATTIIDAEGDSTMYGLQMVNGQFVQSAHPVPVLVQARLQAQFGPGITVNNNGAPGANSNDELQGNVHYSTPLQARLAVSHAQVVLENFGINDAYLPAAQYRSNLLAFIDLVRASGKLPVLEEPNPVCSGHEALDERVAILDEVAAEKSVPLVKQYAYIKALPNWQGLLTDCVHPRDELYAVKASREADILAAVLATMRQV